MMIGKVRNALVQTLMLSSNDLDTM